MCLKQILYVNHSLKIICLHHGIHNNLHILFFQKFLFTYDIFTSLDPTNNIKLLNANYEFKNSNFYLLYIWRKEMDE
jgi:hypothetical protein